MWSDGNFNRDNTFLPFFNAAPALHRKTVIGMSYIDSPAVMCMGFFYPHAAPERIALPFYSPGTIAQVPDRINACHE
jgi:hypothetical protein